MDDTLIASVAEMFAIRRGKSVVTETETTDCIAIRSVGWGEVSGPARQQVADSLGAIRELRQFLSIVAEAPQPLAMFGRFIDQVWHALLDAPWYNEWSVNACGQVIDHLPCAHSGVVTWVERYHAKFGTLSPEWFALKDGRVDSVAYDNYTARLVLEAVEQRSWGFRKVIKFSGAIESCWNYPLVSDCLAKRREGSIAR